MDAPNDYPMTHLRAVIDADAHHDDERVGRALALDIPKNSRMPVGSLWGIHGPFAKAGLMLIDAGRPMKGAAMQRLRSDAFKTMGRGDL